MLIFWKIRCLDRATKEFGDRCLYLETTSLDPVSRAAIELAAEAKSQSDRRKFIRYRHLFKEGDLTNVLDDWQKNPSGAFKTAPLDEYFEDESGQEISLDDIGRILTGNPNARMIPSGYEQHDIDLMFAKKEPIDFSTIRLTESDLKVLGYFVRDLRQLESSTLMRQGPGTIKAYGHSHAFTQGDPVLETAVTAEEIASAVTVFRRLYIGEKGNFTAATGVFIKTLGDHAYGKWMRGAAKAYHKSLDAIPEPRPFLPQGAATFTRRQLLDVFIYTQYAHQPSSEREQEFAECLQQVQGKKGLLTWMFLTVLWQLGLEIGNAGRPIARFLDAYCDHHGVAPDVLNSLLDDHPGIGTQETEVTRKARLFKERVQQLAEDLWEQAGQPAGGSAQFMAVADEQLRKAME